MSCDLSVRGALILLAAIFILAGCGSDSTGPQEQAVCSIEMTYPTGGEDWTAGDSVTIRWSASEACGSLLMIELFHRGPAESVCDTLEHATDNDGEYAWIVNPCTADTSGYGLRLTDLQTEGSFQEADSITIRPRPGVPCEPTLTAPNGGEAWLEDKLVEITWETSGDCGAAVSLELLQGDLWVATIVDSTENSGSYHWEVTPPNETPTDYRVQVVDLASGNADQSDAAFTIESLCRLQLTAPGGNEAWVVGDAVTIAWEHTGQCSSRVNLELLNVGVVCMVATGVDIADGSFDWTVHQCGGFTAGYTVRVLDPLSGLSSTSGSEIEIQAQCSLDLLAPVGGEEWAEGSLQTIAWEPYGACGDSVRIELLQDGALCALVAESTPNDGSFIWLTARCGTEESAYRLRITNNATGAVVESPGDFTILGPCTLSMTSPADDVLWLVGETVTLTWRSTGDCGGTVDLELICGEETCLIASGIDRAAGSYTWVAVPCGDCSGDHRIRISDPGTGVSALSEGAITIQEMCRLELMAPNVGGTWTAGNPVAIIWESSGACPGTVDIQLLRGGLLCRTIVSGLPDTGSHTWMAEQCDGEPDGYRIRVVADAIASDASDTDFRIDPVPCQLQVTLPDSATVWTAGQAVTVTWEHNDHCGTDVDLLLHKGETETWTIVLNTDNDGSHALELPETLLGGSDYRLEVVNNQTASFSDYFIIEPAACVLSLTAPAAGAEHDAGTPVTVLWEQSGACELVVSLALLKNDAVVQAIADGVGNDGSYTFTLGDDLVDGADYHVQVTSGDATALSAAFTVHELPCELEVTSPDGATEWTAGEEVAVSWNTINNCGDQVDLLLFRGGTQVQVIGEDVPNVGTHTFTLLGTLEDGTDYHVQVASGEAGAQSADFTIHAVECVHQITLPDAMTAWQAGEEVTVTWDHAASCPAEIGLILYQGIDSVLTIAAPTPNDGEHTFLLDDTLAEGDDYLVLLVSESGNVPGAYFTIHSAPCDITILAPTGEAEWMVGDEAEILWDHAGLCSDLVDLELCRGDSSVVQTIAHDTDNDGSHIFDPAVSLPDSDDYRVRITCSAVVVYSEFFAIRQPLDCAMGITAPAADSVWTAGSEAIVHWESIGPCGDAVELYLFKGETRLLILSLNTPNDGNYTVEELEPNLETGTDYRVRLIGIADSDFSDYFTIEQMPCALDVLVPNASTQWAVGVEVTTTWDADQGCSELVDLTLCTADSAVVQVIATGAPNTGSHTFTLDGGLTPIDNGYLLRVRDPEDPTGDDYSELFTISEPCLMEFDKPVAGTVWAAGSTVAVIWNYDEYCAATVDLHLCLGDSSVVQTLAEGVDNNGSHIVTLDESLAAGGDYLLHVVSGAAEAYSEAFNIVVVTFSDPPASTPWEAGTQATALWSCAGSCPALIDLELYESTTQVQVLGTGIDNDGAQTFQLRPDLVPGTDYRLRIRQDEVEAFSAPFEITAPSACVLWVTVPHGETLWTAGDQETAAWVEGGPCGAVVDLELLEGAVPVQTIATGVADEGAFTFILDPALPAGSDYHLRVANGGAEVLSEAFAIAEPATCTVWIQHPAPGALWTAGTQATIVWSAGGPDCAATVDLELYKDAVMAQAIETGTANDGGHEFTLDLGLDPGSDYFVRLTCGGTVFESELFEIAAPEDCDYWILEPNAATVWEIGTEVTASWVNGGPCGATISLYIANGAITKPVATDIENNGSYTFTLEGNHVPPNPHSTFTFRIVDITGEYDSDPFTIQ